MENDIDLCLVYVGVLVLHKRGIGFISSTEFCNYAAHTSSNRAASCCIPQLEAISSCCTDLIESLESCQKCYVMDMKGISWIGDIYQKFEAMCLEMEDAMYQVKFTSCLLLFDLVCSFSQGSISNVIAELPLAGYFLTNW